MKQLTLFLAMIIVSVSCFANVDSDNTKIRSLGNVWKTYQSTTPKQPQNDINIVYGGEDISLKRNLLSTKFYA